MDELFRDNPVLTREVQVALGLRRQQAPSKRALGALGGWLFVAAVYGGCFYLLAIANDIAGPQNGIASSRFVAMMLYSVLIYIMMLVHVFGPASMTATAITSEREKQTWNALLLSRLTNAQLVVGKLAGGLASFVLGTLIFLPLLLVLGVAGGIPVGVFLGSLLLVALVSGFSAILGLFVSWLAKNSKMATSTTSGLVLALILGTGGLTVVMSGMLAYAEYHNLVHIGDPTPYTVPPMFLNPFYGLTCLLSGWWNQLEGGAHPTPALLNPAIGLISVTFCATTAVLMLRAMFSRLTRGKKDMTG